MYSETKKAFLNISQMPEAGKLCIVFNTFSAKFDHFDNLEVLQTVYQM